jgi:general L-amino acid transport system ATP-binding protein
MNDPASTDTTPTEPEGPEEPGTDAPAADAPAAAIGLRDLATTPGGTGEPVIECTGVEKWFGKFQDLRGIDLVVGKQEVVVVIGRYGSGKRLE